jgi:hypothetical protein
MTTVKVQALIPGQEVALVGCVKTGTIIRRLGNGRYLVSWCGHEVELLRSQLGVKVAGQWMTGAHNAQD